MKSIYRELTTKEFANLILSSQGVGYSFMMEDDEEKAPPVFNIVTLNLFDIQVIYINQEFIGGKEYVFDIIEFDFDIDTENGEMQNEACLQSVVDRLNKYNNMYGNRTGKWYVDIFETITIG